MQGKTVAVISAMRKRSEHSHGSLAGSLLVAHPSLLDPNFRKSVVLLSAHSAEEGAIGIVLNKPIGKTLGELDEAFALSPLADVPIYKGGPVSQDQMLLAAWNWAEETGIFKLYFGISQDRAKEILEEEPGTIVRGFLGYSGWTGGQLEGEMKQNAWVVTPMAGDDVRHLEGDTLWRKMLLRNHPELTFLADAPEDPSRN